MMRAWIDHAQICGWVHRRRNNHKHTHIRPNRPIACHPTQHTYIVEQRHVKRVALAQQGRPCLLHGSRHASAPPEAAAARALACRRRAAAAHNTPPAPPPRLGARNPPGLTQRTGRHARQLGPRCSPPAPGLPVFIVGAWVGGGGSVGKPGGESHQSTSTIAHRPFATSKRPASIFQSPRARAPRPPSRRNPPVEGGRPRRSRGTQERVAMHGVAHIFGGGRHRMWPSAAAA